MKKQVKLTESELYDVIKESVKSLVMEYGETSPKVRSAMAKAAKRALDNGDDGIYHNAVSSITRAGGSQDALQDLNDKFELEDSNSLEEYTDSEMRMMYGRNSDYDDELNMQPTNILTSENKKPIKVNESQLMAIIRESVNMILKEYGNSQVGQYQLGRLAARKKANGDEEGYKNVVNKAKLQWGADRGVGTNQNAFGNGMHVGKDNVKQGYDLAKKGKL